MLASLGSKKEEMEILEKAKQFSKGISERLHLSEDIRGRLIYALILRGLARKLGVQLCFKEKDIDELCDRLSDAIDLDIEKIAHNPELLDSLYESLVSPSYKKKFGQFLTPNYIAEFMASWINQDKPQRVLDPTVGTGIFLECILKTSDLMPKGLWGFDIDPILLNVCQLRLALRGFSGDALHLIEQDFIKMEEFLAEKVDAVICNPPYLNFHDFDRNGLVKPVEERMGVKLSRLTNIYVLFFLQSLSFTKDGGKLAFITPSEFLYTGYGEELKAFLLKNATIDSIILMDFEYPVFNKALTTAAITLFRKGLPKSRHKVRFIKVYDWSNPKELLQGIASGIKFSGKYRIVEVYQDELIPEKKWLEYFVDIKNSNVLNRLVPLSKLADIDRGIATGFNEYFVLNRSEIRKWKIEQEFVVPVVPNALQVQGYNFTVDDLNRLEENDDKVYLLYVFKEPSQDLKKYIEYGEQKEIGANQRYITKHRSPWYSMERKEPAKILATVFHRKNMRFILNSANVRNLAPFHCVNPKFDDIIMVKALLAYLNSDLCRDIQTIKRREYGGGLHKFEPRDLENIPSLDVTRLSRMDVENLASLFDALCLAFGNKEKEREIRRKLDELLHYLISEL
jgi:adenine-specific DNA-methyltransferase